ncbi:FxLD family lanthipeptide [Actinopolyspora saharensis]|uniref:FxLD family lantipeptide n=1 Tax=Actinopolyspora saharensis TaxID=995062 RepID=A0A1H0YH20_9ACTN|nr:FxLD family lanthipeptide [Actinopolyspora saharensis]SDQ14442.1 FxLD family lantipeptide [Actinopolyspora saharensis]
MAAALAGETVEDVFELDVQVTTEEVPFRERACQTDDGCGHTCEKSACTTTA